MKKNLALCEGRHPIPGVSGAVFPGTVNPVDVAALDALAAQSLEGVTELTLYVTGLTVALVAVINACHKNGVRLVLMHYDRTTGGYYPQEVA